MRKYAERLTIGAVGVVFIFGVVDKIGAVLGERLLTSPLYHCLIGKFPLPEEWFGPPPSCPNHHSTSASAPHSTSANAPQRRPNEQDRDREGPSRSGGFGDAGSGEAYRGGGSEAHSRGGPAEMSRDHADGFGNARDEDFRDGGIDRRGFTYRRWRICTAPPGHIRHCGAWQYGPAAWDWVQ